MILFDIENRLLRVGKRLLDPPLDVEQLFALLDKVGSLLSEIDQSPNKPIATSLVPLMRALITKELLSHSDTNVKVSVAHCISEIMRITAPLPPFGDEIMKDIFEVLIDAFAFLDDINSDLYTKRVVILGTLAKVKSCVILLDLSCDGLVLQMFNHFFNAMRVKHPDEVCKAIETIMTFMVQESDSIPYDLSKCLLSSVKKNSKDFSPIISSLGERVIRNCSTILKPCLMEVISSMGSPLSDYPEFVALLCQDNADGLINNNSGECSIAKSNSSEGTISEELLQESGNLDANISCKKVGITMDDSKKEISKSVTSKCVNQEIKTDQSFGQNIKKIRDLGNMEITAPLENVKDSVEKDPVEKDPIESNKKTINTTSPMLSVTPGAKGRKKGRPSLAKTQVKKEKVNKNNSTLEKEVGSSGVDHLQKLKSSKRIQQKESNKKSSSLTKAEKSESQKVVTTKKRRRSNGQDTALGQELIGSSIKVWWPIDKEFYHGVVDSFNPSTKKHKVLYADGETENLLLKNERWKYAQSDNSCSDAMDDQDLPTSNARTMSPDIEKSISDQKKQGKTKSEDTSVFEQKGSVSTPDKIHGGDEFLNKSDGTRNPSKEKHVEPEIENAGKSKDATISMTRKPKQNRAALNRKSSNGLRSRGSNNISNAKKTSKMGRKPKYIVQEIDPMVSDIPENSDDTIDDPKVSVGKSS
ncbi:hypothetical protein ZOSMA_69G00070 [Zostera marina]|uniref:Tudor domain-containing protein n=1 Tax=Zostera marina TaxID=29655 RepID=A0A0K9NRB1_ZOSMR|nr:hypothetical protein ZOSMA_69G00070 [Zostera marina]